jgi:hypothetical protein
MNLIRLHIFCSVSAMLLAVLACTSPMAQKKATPVPTIKATVAVQASPSPQPELPTDTSAPTDTVLSVETATETPLPVGVIPTETPAATLEAVFADVMKETNCRTGPSGGYELVTTFQAGAKVEVAARDLGGGFIVVKNPADPTVECYVLVNNVKISGDTSVLPQYTPLASPTAAPNFKATFKKYDDCKGDVFALFDVVNTGSVPFRSAYIKVTNLKTGESTEQVVNAFDLVVGCMIAKNVAPLDPGASGWLASKLFLHNPSGSKMRAVIQACTEKNLKGSCVTTTIPFQ